MNITSAQQKKTRQGTTLIELLVVIGIIGVLFSISFPALMRARAAGGQSKSLANARSIAITIDAYREAHSDTYPIIKANVSYQAQLDSGPGLSIMSLDPAEAAWMTRIRWYAVLGDFAPIDENLESWVSPGLDPSEASFPSYVFSNSFVAAPRLWTPQFDGDLSVIHAVRSSQVDHPALKAMIWDTVMAYVSRSVQSGPGGATRQTPIAFADMHAAAKRIADAVEAFPNPLFDDTIFGRAKLNNTPRGVAGFDFGAGTN